MSELSFVRALLFMLAGMLIWAAHFLFVYGFTAVACTLGIADRNVLGFGLVPLTVGAATASAMGAAAWVLLRAHTSRGPSGEPSDDRTARFIRDITIAVAALSIVPILWDGLPAFMISACG